MGIAVGRPTAIELTLAHSPDLALIDLHLARQTSGAEAAACMCASLGIPSIILGGSLHGRTEVEIATIDPVTMLGKLFSPMKLHGAVREVARNSAPFDAAE
ncbi:hypothetical protein [Limimaricola cinnabarinus]|jgi:DNA-binding response OmpR family regulator|uniref:hypothetical protein n=1 Tax=Limimaricola cinnabarinus TaxID=1125964 RepID=UPI002FE0F7B1